MALQERNPYTLMTLDIMMPEMDGQHLLSAFRDKEDDLKLPFPGRLKVVMISALDDTENVMKAFYSLADAYLIKPISKEKLVEVLGQLGLKK